MVKNCFCISKHIECVYTENHIKLSPKIMQCGDYSTPRSLKRYIYTFKGTENIVVNMGIDLQ